MNRSNRVRALGPFPHHGSQEKSGPPGPSLLFCLSLAASVALCLATAAAGQQARLATRPAGGRVLHFPKDNPVKAWLAAYLPDASPYRGLAPVEARQLKLRRENKGKPGNNIEVLGELRGDVTVPPGKRLLLRILLPAHGSLDLSWLSQFAPDDLYALQTFPCEGVYMQLPEPKSANDIIPHITRLTGLRLLNLAGFDVKAESVDQLAQLKNLEQLPSPCNDLTRLARFRNLRAISLQRNPGDKDLARLESFPALETLRISGGLRWKLTDAGLAHLAKVPRLRSLELRGQNITDASMAPVALIPSLKFLNVADQQITDAGLADLAKAPALEGLNLNNTLVTDDGLAHLKSMRTLKALNLVTGRPTLIRGDNRPRITTRALVHLSEIKSLEYFDLDVGDEDLAYVSKLPNLKYLSAGKSDFALEQISRIASLECLYAGGPQVTDAGAAHLARLKNLQKLVITAPITDRGLAHLSNLTSLRILKIMGGARISMSGLRQLNRLSNLVFLHIYDDIQPDGSALDLSGLTTLEDLMLTADPKTPFTDRDLATVLKLKNMRYLDLTGDYTAEAKARVTRLPRLKSWAGVVLAPPEWPTGFLE